MARNARSERSAGGWERRLLPSMILPEELDLSIVAYKCIREGLVGEYDYAFLFRPNLPFMKRERRAAPW
jgi:hypothetical protein